MGRVIQQHIIDVIAIDWLVNENCTRIRIIIAFKCYWLIIYQIYDMLFKDRVVMYLSWKLMPSCWYRSPVSYNWNNSSWWNEWSDIWYWYKYEYVRYCKKCNRANLTPSIPWTEWFPDFYLMRPFLIGWFVRVVPWLAANVRLYSCSSGYIRTFARGRPASVTGALPSIPVLIDFPTKEWSPPSTMRHTIGIAIKSLLWNDPRKRVRSVADSRCT
jgi:hypothetical protein